MNLTTLIFVIVLFVVTSLLYVGTTRFLIKRGRKGRHPINRDN